MSNTELLFSAFTQRAKDSTFKLPQAYERINSVEEINRQAKNEKGFERRKKQGEKIAVVLCYNLQELRKNGNGNGVSH